MADCVEKRVELKAPISRVWRAPIDYREFGERFHVKLEDPFVPGHLSRGRITYPDHENTQFEAAVQKMEPERPFSLTWHPYPANPQIDYSRDTLVEFKLEKNAKGTLLRVTEFGFDKVPGDRRLEIFRVNDDGWAEQLKNIARYLA